MSREFSIRISRDLAAWVKRQGASPARVIAGLLSAALSGRLDLAGVRDPGPDSERLTVRIPERALPMIREAAHSRDNLVALRKLIQAGASASAGTRALPGGAPAPSNTTTAALPSRPLLPARPTPAIAAPRVQMVPQLPGWITDAPLSTYAREMAGRDLEGPRDFLQSPSRTEVARASLVPGTVWLAGIVLFYLGRWLFSKAAATTAGAGGVAPTVAAWTPQAATGLGRMFL